MSGVDERAGRSGAAVRRPVQRDAFIDFIRAFSLLVVVVWHWAFTIVLWERDGPHATSPLGFTSGMWVVTWLFQVMPLFFFVGGYANLRAYQSGRRKGRDMAQFVGSRVRQLAVPSIIVTLVWVGIGVVVAAIWRADWIANAVILVLSPLWFIVTYLLLIALFPVLYRLHARFGPLVVVFMIGLAAVVDAARFDHGYDNAGWLNMVFVWGLCFQLGFFYPTFVRWPRRDLWLLAWAGFFALCALVYSNTYPGSMVGVPGEKVSNMAPPTLAIAGLLFFQVGVAMLLRPWLLERLVTPRWARANKVMNRFALPLFLFHTSGLAIAWSLGYLLNGRENPTDANPDLGWWLTRPFALLAPLIVTLPIIFIFGRKWVKSPTEVQDTVTPAVPAG